MVPQNPPKRRGRPPGSKNKPKIPVVAVSQTIVDVEKPTFLQVGDTGWFNYTADSSIPSWLHKLSLEVVEVLPNGRYRVQTKTAGKPIYEVSGACITTVDLWREKEDKIRNERFSAVL